jgi:hypothetical protein
MKISKFHAQKVTIDGIEFASNAEGKRYGELKYLQMAKDIKALSCHPVFPLVVNGVTIGKYTADFVYFEGGRRVCEDVKGIVTPEASLRMRLFKALHPDVELRLIQRGQAKAFKQRKVTVGEAA